MLPSVPQPTEEYEENEFNFEEKDDDKLRFKELEVGDILYARGISPEEIRNRRLYTRSEITSIRLLKKSVDIHAAHNAKQPKKSFEEIVPGYIQDFKDVFDNVKFK